MPNVWFAVAVLHWVAGYGCLGWTAGAQRVTEEVLAVLEEVAGSGRVKPQQRAELCQLRNNGVVCLSLAGYQAKGLWCEFICWLFPVRDVMLSVSAIFITPSSVVSTCSQSQPQKVWKQLLDLFCILSADLWHNQSAAWLPPSPPPSLLLPSPSSLSQRFVKLSCLYLLSQASRQVTGWFMPW